MPKIEFGGPPSQETGLTPKEWRPEVNARVFVKRKNGAIEEDWLVLRVENGIVTVGKQNLDNLGNIIKNIPVSKLEGLNNKEVVNFSEAESFMDLYKLINYKGNIKGSSQEYTPQVLEEVIEKVRRGDLELNYITQEDNLRDVVRKLLAKEKE